MYPSHLTELRTRVRRWQDRYKRELIAADRAGRISDKAVCQVVETGRRLAIATAALAKAEGRDT